MIPLSGAILPALAIDIRAPGGAARTGPLIAFPTGPLTTIRAPGAARTGPLIAVECLRRRSIARTGPLIAFPTGPLIAIRAPEGAALTEPVIVGLPILMIPRIRRFALALPMAFVGCQFPHLFADLLPLVFWNLFGHHWLVVVLLSSDLWSEMTYSSNLST